MSETDNLYYHHVRDDLLPLFDNLRGINVLEVGCGSGATGAYLKHLGIARSVTGVEKEADPAREAAAQIDRVLCDDIETISFDNFNETFDVILLADVLEHLVDPWMTLTQLAGLLSNGGAIIASIPNVRYWRVIRDVVLKGDWHYSEFGILDVHHLRFFTRKSIQYLFLHAGCYVEKWLLPPPRGKTGLVNALTLGIFKDFMIRQFLLRAKLKPNVRDMRA